MVLSILTLLLLNTVGILGYNLVAELDLGGLKGNITFSPASDNKVQIFVFLHENSDTRWTDKVLSIAIHKWPVDYTYKDKCGANLGSQYLDLTDLLPGGAVGGTWDPVSTDKVHLLGKETIWGRSLKITAGSLASCATIQAVGDDVSVRNIEARFLHPTAGQVWMRSLAVGDEITTTIFTNLFDVENDRGTASTNDWQIFTTDVLTVKAKRRGSCNFLQDLYAPSLEVKEGDLSSRLGPVKVAQKNSRFSKKFLVDTKLHFPNLASSRDLYIVLFEEGNRDKFHACAKLREIKPTRAEANIQMDGVKARIIFQQNTPFQPTEVTLNFYGLGMEAGGYHVHNYPVPPRLNAGDNPCKQTSGHYNPFGIGDTPDPTLGTPDQYEVGDLSGKHALLTGVTTLENITRIDTNLPLWGANSVIGRSIVVHKAKNAERWACANINRKVPMATAIALFKYPVVGRVIFRQPQSDEFADTTVFVESLLYSDGTANDTFSHRWHIHNERPGSDYYNWTSRCVSAGGHYNPYYVSLDEHGYKNCRPENPQRCEVGDLVNKLGRLTVTSTRRNLPNTKRMFTDSSLPLSGPKSIIGKSIVIHDDHAPKHRGDRMACTPIAPHHRHKAAVAKWAFNKDEVPGSWEIEMTQENEYEDTNVEVEFKGLKQLAGGYHIHQVPIKYHKQFPCIEALGHYNPFQSKPPFSPATGTPDQYEVGDLSNKWGMLDNKGYYETYYNDSNLPLYGVHSVVGRSIVIHKKQKGQRWLCGTLGWGYSPSQARQISGIASFHHPKGFAYGYIKFKQVVYHDGSTSDTTVEIDLHYPGENDKNHTRNHAWEIWVNPVSTDATVKHYLSRCSAGGYIWNPYLTQLADPDNTDLYRAECSPFTPHRCKAGDLTGKLGRIEVGGKREVYNDANLPLGDETVILGSGIGRSVVIFDKDGSSNRFACANIEFDHDIYKVGAILKTPSFSASLFIKEAREIMGVQPWMLEIDLRSITELTNSSCIQFKVYFLGPKASKLEKDFSRLLLGLPLRSPSLNILGYVPDRKRKQKLSYSPCPSYAGVPESSATLQESTLVAILLLALVPKLIL